MERTKDLLQLIGMLTRSWNREQVEIDGRERRLFKGRWVHVEEPRAWEFGGERACIDAWMIE